MRSDVFRMGAAVHENVREILRCPYCCEGNNINPIAEKRAVDHYLLRWRTWAAEAAARGEELIEPGRARQEAEDAHQRQQQQEYASQQKACTQTRQRRHIARSRQVEARLDERPLPPPSEQEWAVLHNIVGQYRKPARSEKQAGGGAR